MRCSTSVTAQASSRVRTEAGIDHEFGWSPWTPSTCLFRRDGRGAVPAPPDRRRKSGKRHRTAWRGGPVGGAGCRTWPRSASHRAAATSSGPSTRSHAEHAVEAVRALRPLGPILQPRSSSPQRSAPSQPTRSGYSPFHERDSVCIHFAWKPLAPKVQAVLPRIEDRPRAVRAEAALGNGIVRVAHAVATRDYLRFARSAPASTPIGSLATRSTLGSGT